ncbi:DUF1190 domain-containing protein [Agrobacterium sp. SORGH_AS 787]|uniref:DUF1190 domain-containing protein n=1 Tax=Agrobacterium sp. SORGH_AS 787 TaxID=3041775 RepID=UPI00277EDECE|nr:uncharacterized protein YgiB involved in biofilm formation [Rhizobium sp. SORGH_AS_0787]
MKRRMRSHARPVLALGTITVSGLALAGCGEQPPDAFVFKSTQQCVMSGIGADVCDVAFRDATTDYAKNAPRFADQASCEDSFGSGLCARSPRDAQDVAPFIPVLTGFYLARNVRSIAEYNAERKRQEEEEEAAASSGGVGGSGGGGGSFRSGSGSAVYKDRQGTAMVARSQNGQAGNNSYRFLKNVSYGVPETTARSGFGHWSSSSHYGS